MQFTGLKNILRSISTSTWISFRWRYHDVTIEIGDGDERKKYFRDRKMILREFNMEYGRLVVLIRQNSAAIWGFRYGLTLGIGTLKIIANTGRFRA